MQIRLVICVFLVILFCKDCTACFQHNSMNNLSIIAPTSFYEECYCTEEGYSIMDLQWLDPMDRVIGPGTDSNVYIEEQDNYLILRIPNTNPTLSGSYKCVTTYNGVQHSKTHNLDIFEKLVFINTPRTQHLTFGKDGIIKCDVKRASKPFVQWYMGKDGQNKIKNDTIKYQFLPEGLLVKNVTHEDAGDYKCSALALLTAEEVEVDIKVEIVTEPTIARLAALPEEIVAAGTPLIIECTAEGQPPPTYSWQKVLGLTPNNEQRNETWQEEDNRIRFDSVEAEDAGIYECYVENFVGNYTSFIEIKVLVPPEIIDFKNRTIKEGDEIPIVCNATGIPQPNVTITFEGKNLEEQNVMYEEINNYSLLKVTRETEGYYICNATNEVNFATEVMYLTVEHKPYFAVDKEILWGWNGEIVELNCEHEANPPATLTWRYTINKVAKAEEIDINNDLSKASINDMIYIPYYFVEDFAPYGTYDCKAKNYLGDAHKLIEVRPGFVPGTVQNVTILTITTTTVVFAIDTPQNYEGPPILGFKAEYDLTGNYNITHIHQNRTWALDRPYKLEKLKANSTYYVRFAAINKVGSGPWSAMIEFDTLEKSVPEPPIWQVDSLQSSNVLKWEEPEDNGESIDYYILRYCKIVQEFEEPQCNEKLIVASTECELEDLEFNTTYSFQITAHNSEGDSTPANISISIPAAEGFVKAQLLSGGAIIGISIVIIIVCLVLLDVLFLVWRRQGIIASCCYKKSKKKPETVHSRDKKGLLKDNAENTDDTLRRPNNGHREYEYNKTTGIITGKHSSV